MSIDSSAGPTAPASSEPIPVKKVIAGTVGATIGASIGVACLFWIFGDLMQDSPWVWYFAVVGMGAMWLLLVLLTWLSTSKNFMAAVARGNQEHERRLQEKAAREAPALERARAVIIRKLPELRRVRAACLSKWGELNLPAWEKEKTDFINAVLRPALPRDDIAQLRPARLLAFIDATLAESSGGAPQGMTGVAYEEFCAGLLRGAGWSVEVTKASGDQGVDLIATKGPWRVALQCKRYSGSVPNAAVQEVSAGSVFYAANARAVVSTGSYTASARSLAEATRTMLLSHEQLSALEGLLPSNKGE